MSAPERMRHPVAEAATAIDDVEGFWTQGHDLDEAGVYSLNEAILDGRATVVREDSKRWLITLGRGLTYLVEPVLTCSSCGQRVWIDEVNFIDWHVHSDCYDRREP
jgi:hypothetical protein